MLSRVTETCFCAFCKEPRKIYVKRHVGVTNVLLSLVAANLLMLIIWGQFEARVIFLFVLSLIVAEVFIQLRWRLTLPCPQCQFDPILYKKNPERAAARVAEHYELKKQQPSFYLSRNPLLKLSVARSLSRRQQKNTSSLISKSANPSGQTLSKTV